MNGQENYADELLRQSTVIPAPPGWTLVTDNGPEHPLGTDPVLAFLVSPHAAHIPLLAPITPRSYGDDIGNLQLFMAEQALVAPDGQAYDCTGESVYANVEAWLQARRRVVKEKGPSSNNNCPGLDGSMNTLQHQRG